MTQFVSHNHSLSATEELKPMEGLSNVDTEVNSQQFVVIPPRGQMRGPVHLDTVCHFHSRLFHSCQYGNT